MDSSIPRDVRLFLEGYPGLPDDPSLNANLKFYTLRQWCLPDKLNLNQIHTQWAGDYRTLESNHNFIQWLFPIREQGVNFFAQPLQTHERDAMKSDPDVVARVVKSYELMLDFYGMKLLSQETGLLARVTEPELQWLSRYRNLVRMSHNNLRITRILKCLSEMGLEHLNAGFLLHFLNEQSEHGQLAPFSLMSSMDRWWANCIRNDEERAWLGDLIEDVRNYTTNTVWTREMYERALERRKETGSFVERDDAESEEGEENKSDGQTASPPAAAASPERIAD
ncbi:opioid growth factor receptor conserved region-domain-containing protein [Phanerochaete sordida]|uniref:Opioid growth factor receptor conserved region-domain-containing protein n=1 Tax=Phanerochaete sordida TaxID=48140 RepID=A0A9P3G686_9APHY|nr:opioid growth factor receptor conserved region-domain-containing protein [Phanerochaete sordida]